MSTDQAARPEATLDRPVEGGPRRRAARAVRFLAANEVRFARTVLGVAALHLADDSFLQPAPGTSPLDHLTSGLVPIGILLLAGIVYPRRRAGLRAASAAGFGVLAVLVGVPGAFYLYRGEAAGADYTGLLSITAGMLLILTIPFMLWSSRRTDGSWRVRIARRSLWALSAAVATPLVLLWIVFPVGLGYIYFHAGRTALEPKLGVPTQRVEVRTSDSLKLAAWYVPSKNRAAVVLFPGPDRTKEAQMLLRHGYGVLLLEGRGQNGSEGDVNRWAGDRDLRAGAAYLQHRGDVDRSRIGAIGFSIGGEILLEAAAQSSAFRAVVSEGAGERVGETDVRVRSDCSSARRRRCSRRPRPCSPTRGRHRRSSIASG